MGKRLAQLAEVVSALFTTHFTWQLFSCDVFVWMWSHEECSVPFVAASFGWSIHTLPYCVGVPFLPLPAPHSSLVEYHPITWVLNEVIWCLSVCVSLCLVSVSHSSVILLGECRALWGECEWSLIHEKQGDPLIFNSSWQCNCQVRSVISSLNCPREAELLCH